MNNYIYEIICLITSLSGISFSYKKLNKTPYNAIFLSAVISTLLRSYRLILNKPGQTIDHPLLWADVICAIFTYIVVLFSCPSEAKWICSLSFILMTLSIISWPFHKKLGNYPHSAAHILNIVALQLYNF